MYLIPDLDHVKPYIRWAETHYPNVEVRQIVHNQRDSFDKFGFFQEGEGNPDIHERKIGEVEEMVRQETGIKWLFSGMKGVDGYMKRMRLLTFRKRNPDGLFISDKGMVYPLAVWTNKEVLRYISTKKLIKPFVYNEDDVSQGFGIDLCTLLVLKERFPRDYAKAIKEFPYAEKLIFDYEEYGIIPYKQEKEIAERFRLLEEDDDQ